MNGRWTKLGRIYNPESAERHPKLRTHAANPLPVQLDDDIYRIFFSARDVQNRSSVGAVDIDIVKGFVVKEHHEPIFEHGPPGSFYADGVSIGSCYHADGVHYMLFMGWQTPADGHWRGDVGRLIVRPDLTLELASPEPFMGVDASDRLSLSYPWVMEQDDGGFHMWYGSTVTWNAGNGEMIHTINYATSADGHFWQRHGQAVPHQIGIAQAFSRPTVAHSTDGGYHMWFSVRSGLGEKYRIGYAHSTDARNWQLQLAKAGITVSEEGWDSEMIEYPFVFFHKNKQYMLYNGNEYGKTGFGLAVKEA